MRALQKCCLSSQNDGEKINANKTQLELRLDTMGDKKKWPLKYINNNRRMRDNTGPLLHKDVHLTNSSTDKEETFNALLTCVFHIDDGP